MNKKRAITVLNAYFREELLDMATTRFANINAKKPVWWLDIPLEAIETDDQLPLNLVLADCIAGELHLLSVPVQFARENLPRLVIRNEKQCVSLELAAFGSNRFRDERPTSGHVDFGHFLQATIRIEASDCEQPD